MADHIIKFTNSDGVSYDLTDLIEEHDDGSNTRLNIALVPKRHGALVTEVPVFEPRKIKLRGTLYGATKEEVRDELRTMRVVIGRKRGKLRFFNDRYFNAYLFGFSHAYIQGSALLSVSFVLEFLCDDPFEYSDGATNETEQILTAGDTVIDPTNNIYRKEFTLNNPGAIFVYFVSTVTPDQGFTVLRSIIRNTTVGRLNQYTGSIATDQILVIDNGQLTVKKSGVEDYVNFAGSFLWLEPGNNTMQIEGQPASYKFNYAHRWI